MKKQNRVYAIPFLSEPADKHIRKDITSNPRLFVECMMTGSRFRFGLDNIKIHGVYLELGYKYDLRPFLKRYVYKKDGQWSEIWALNYENVKYQVRGRIDKIIEVKE